jgi:hypothetical protein
MHWMTDPYITARFLSPGLLIALMMEAARTSETLVNFYQTTRCYNPEDSNLQFQFSLIPFNSFIKEFVNRKSSSLSVSPSDLM